MLKLLLIQVFFFLISSIPVHAHAPYGQYQVYRQKHLLIMSTIVDEPTYPYSKKLVEALNQVIPEALARPARAKNFERVHSLFKTKQLHLVLLSKSNAKALLEGSGPFSDFGAVNVRTLYAFGDMLLLVQPDFPDSHVWLLADAFKKIHSRLPGALTPQQIMVLPNLHPSALLAFRGNPIP
jgi:hypothetical protein